MPSGAVADEDLADEPPVAVVVPHAGHVYSGVVAGSVYARLAPYRDRIRQVVVIGPAHWARVSGLATVGVDALDTPLGPVTVDAELRALGHAAVHVDVRAHADEHCLEVQLPFLVRALGGVSVLPLVVGDASAQTAAEVLQDVWGRAGVLVVVSTDVSHDNDAATADRLDERTAAAVAVVAGALDTISSADACGATPLRGSLLVTRRRGEHARLVVLCTSADTAGGRDRVVGYGGFEIR